MTHSENINEKLQQNEYKHMAAASAIKYVKSGMILGLGTGSTAAYFVEELAKKVNKDKIKIKAVTTSLETKKQAEKLGIEILPFDSITGVDLTVDGADEFDSKLNGIKGGGAALLMEKIVASYSKNYIWITDESKEVNCLGAFPLPIEVVPFGSQLLFQHFKELGYHPSWRINKDGKKKVTDQQHYIIDLHLGQIKDEWALAKKLDETIGVVEHGLFLDMAQKIIIAGKTGIRTIERSQNR